MKVAIVPLFFASGPEGGLRSWLTGTPGLEFGIQLQPFPDAGGIRQEENAFY